MVVFTIIKNTLANSVIQKTQCIFSVTTLNTFLDMELTMTPDQRLRSRLRLLRCRETFLLETCMNAQLPPEVHDHSRFLTLRKCLSSLLNLCHLSNYKMASHFYFNLICISSITGNIEHFSHVCQPSIHILEMLILSY